MDAQGKQKATGGVGGVRVVRGFRGPARAAAGAAVCCVLFLSLQASGQTDGAFAPEECRALDVVCQLRGFFDFLSCSLLALVEPLVVGLLAVLPGGLIERIGAASQYFPLIDPWVDIAFVFSFATGWITFVSTFAAVKIVIKLIPSIG